MTADDITGNDARRALNGNDDESQHRDDLLKLEFIRVVETLGLERAQTLLNTMRQPGMGFEGFVMTCPHCAEPLTPGDHTARICGHCQGAL